MFKCLMRPSLNLKHQRLSSKCDSDPALILLQFLFHTIYPSAHWAVFPNSEIYVIEIFSFRESLQNATFCLRSMQCRVTCSSFPFPPPPSTTLGNMLTIGVEYVGKRICKEYSSMFHECRDEGLVKWEEAWAQLHEQDIVVARME